MTFWDFMGNHGTKLLGSATAMVGAAQLGLSSLVSGNAITQTHGLIAQFVLGVLAAGLGGATIVRGFSTGAVVQQAKAVLAANPIPPQQPAPPAKVVP